MKKVSALILALIMIVAAFAACGTKTAEPAEADTATEVHGFFHSYLPQAAATLNTWVDTNTAPFTLRSLTTAQLYNDYPTEDGLGWQWECELAEDWPQKVDEEGKVWRFSMKKEACWANGEPMNIDDWIYSLQMRIDPIQLNLGAVNVTSNQTCHVVNVEKYFAGECGWEDVGVKKIDDYTAEITVDRGIPQINVISFLSGPNFVYRPLYEGGMSEDKSVTNWGTSVDTYMSCGAFILTEWIPDAKFTLVRNDKFINADRIHLEGRDYRVILDSETALQLFLNGDIDYCALNFNDWENFEDDPRVYEFFNDSLMYMFINFGNPEQNNLLGSLDFRKALSHAIDRVELAKTIRCYPATRYVRRAVLGNNITGKPFVDFPQDYVKTPEELFDVALANEYLAKAYEEKGLTSATAEIIQSETATHGKAANEMLQKQYSEAFGDKLKVNIRQVPNAIPLRRWNPENPTSYELATGSMLPSATDPRNSFIFFITNYNPPRVKWSNAEYDALYEESNTLDLYDEADADRIVELCQEMEKIVLDQLVIVPIYERPEKCLFSEKVHLPVKQYVVGYGFGEELMTID